MEKLSILSNGKSFMSQAERISSIIVKTGVFQGDINDIAYKKESSLAHKDMVIDPNLIKPNYIVNDSHEAVKLIFQLENFVNA